MTARPPGPPVASAGAGGTGRAGEILRCPFCHQDADGLTLYTIAGVFQLMVCERCYAALLATAHQPHSKLTKRLRRLLGLTGKEVVSNEGVIGGLNGNGKLNTHNHKEHLTCVS